MQLNFVGDMLYATIGNNDFKHNNVAQKVDAL